MPAEDLKVDWAFVEIDFHLRSGCGDRSILCGPQNFAGRKTLRRIATVRTFTIYYKALKTFKKSEISGKNIF